MGGAAEVVSIGALDGGSEIKGDSAVFAVLVRRNDGRRRGRIGLKSAFIVAILGFFEAQAGRHPPEDSIFGPFCQVLHRSALLLVPFRHTDLRRGKME
jgi:hypothetical protein